MARNKVLEQLLGDDLAQVRGITEKSMFGGWASLLHGNLLCGARNDGMLVRLGKGNDAWALAIPGIAPMMMKDRQMHGWIRATPKVYEDDILRRNLLKQRSISPAPYRRNEFARRHIVLVVVLVLDSKRLTGPSVLSHK